MKTRILFIALMMLTGCSKGRDKEIYTKHFVLGYFDTQKIAVYNGRWDGDKQFYENKIISIYTISAECETPPFLDDGRYVDKDTYNALCVKHEDMTFNRKVPFHNPAYFTSCDFVSISLISDASFDAEHLKGCDLGDIIMFHSCSPIKYILSGYTDVTNEYGRPLHFIDKKVSDLDVEDMILLGEGKTLWLANLEFTASPTLAKTHNITVTMTTDDGRVFSDTVQVTWE